LVDTAGEHESLRAREVCAGVQAGEIVIFDKAYVDFTHLADLSTRDVFWVTRAKDNLRCRVVRKLQHGADGNILRDDLIALTSGPSAKAYPVELRRVVALVEVAGQLRQRGPLAGVDGAVDLCAVALLRLVESVVPQLHPALCVVALGPVAKT